MSVPKKGFTRRGFIAATGASVVATKAVAGQDNSSEPIDGDKLTIELHINKRKHKVQVEPRYTLLFVIRDMLGLTATKIGCERGECGACTVLIDGKTRYACMTLAIEAVGQEITTAEGLMQGEELGLVHQAFLEEDAYQCGFCTPGQVVAMDAMLKENPEPDNEEIKVGMSGNLCRCGAYRHIFNAAHNAADKIKSGGGK